MTEKERFEKTLQEVTEAIESAGVNTNPETVTENETITKTSVTKVYGFEYPNGETCTIRFKVESVKDLSLLKNIAESFKTGEVPAEEIARYTVRKHNSKNPILIHTIGEGAETVNAQAEEFTTFERFEFIQKVGFALGHFFLVCRAKG